MSSTDTGDTNVNVSVDMPEVDVKVSFICLRDIMVNLKIYIKVLDFEKDILLHSVDKHQRVQKGQCKMDNPEKLAT